MTRFSLASLLFAVVVVAILAVLNLRESRTVSEPYYAPLLGARWHPPPYDLREQAISVHYDLGWPIWHARHTDVFAAHNAALYLEQDRRHQILVKESELHDLDLFDVRHGGPLHYVLHWNRVAFNVSFAIAIISIFLIGVAAIQRVGSRLRESRTMP